MLWKKTAEQHETHFEKLLDQLVGVREDVVASHAEINARIDELALAAAKHRKLIERINRVI